MTEQELKTKILKIGNLPRHIAIIMDGNGRWALSKNLPRIAGHREGINSVREITRECGELGIEVLTLYTFSKENWKRPIVEVSAIMKLLVETIRTEIDDLMKNNVRLHVIGRLDELPDKPRREMETGIKRTASNTGLNLILALNYGARSEILDAVVKFCKDVENGDTHYENLTEKLFQTYLYTNDVPEPDILIRTSGKHRISNFLLWQIAYTEIYFTSTPWPAFRKQQLYEAILNYQTRERRFGMVGEQMKRSTA